MPRCLRDEEYAINNRGDGHEIEGDGSGYRGTYEPQVKRSGAPNWVAEARSEKILMRGMQWTDQGGSREWH